MTTSISISQVRADSTILPVISSDLSVSVGWLQIGSWQYFPFTSPYTLIPLNRTGVDIPVLVKNCSYPALTLDTGIAEVATHRLQRNSGTGLNGAVTNSAINQTFCSVQAKTTSTALTTGISLQDGSGTITHDYSNVTVAHSIILGQNGQGSIKELGEFPSNNAFFKYEAGDTAMIEIRDTLARYYLIKPDGTMRLLRTTRSKLTENPKAEFLLYFTGSALEKVAVFSNSYEETSYESIGVAFFRNDTKELYWQKWENQKSSQSIGFPIEMADGRTQTTYANQKKRLVSFSLTPKAFTLADYWKFQDFVFWHDTAKEFIFIDYSRNDLEGNPTEFWAKFTGAFIDATRNGCQFDQSQAITEDLRNDYIPRLEDTTPPSVTIDSITEGSAILAGTASDDVLLKSLQLYLNGQKYGAEFLPDANGDWGFTVPTVDLEGGVNSFYVIATDYAGNATQSNTVTLAGDSTVPLISISSADFNGIYHDIIGAASDNSGACTLQLYINGSAVGAPQAHTSGAFTIQILNTLLAEGWNDFVVRATDAIGNYADSNVITHLINKETIPPTLNGDPSATSGDPYEIVVTFPQATDNASGLSGFFGA